MRIILGVEIPFHVEHVTFHITFTSMVPACLHLAITSQDKRLAATTTPFTVFQPYLLHRPSIKPLPSTLIYDLKVTKVIHSTSKRSLS